MKITRLIVGLWIFALVGVQAQNLRYDNRRDIRVPDYATIRVGPFYSNWLLTLGAGVRYVETTGIGRDFLFASSRGRIKEDGWDWPCYIQLSTRNYLVITRRMDLDLSVALRYEYYPLDTQNNEFRVFLPDEGVTANLSFELIANPYLRLSLYDRFAWRTDFVDTRGVEDRYGGVEYEHIANTVGVDGDALLYPLHNLGFGVSRTDEWPFDEAFDYRARASHAGYVRYEWLVRPYAIIGAEAKAEHTYFKRVERPEYLLHGYTVFADVAVTEHSRVDAFAGYAFADILDDDVDPDAQSLDAFIVGGGLTTQLTPDLKHRLSYAHTLRSAWASIAEEADVARYQIDWQRDWSASAYTQYSHVQPGVRSLSSYSDWVSGVSASYPLLRYLTLKGSLRYQARNNAAPAEADDADPELRGDYTTLAARVSTTTKLTDHLDFLLYYEHIERDGDVADLDFTRDIAGAFLTYTREL